ncbi:hypothetical protein COOONC_27576 [Cooperia oncophora]
MEDRPKCGPDEDTLSPIQRELLCEANGSAAFSKPKSSYFKPALFPVIDGKRDADLRRAVFDAVVQLSEVVSEGVLKVQLPFLHCSSWDEVIEERFLGSPRLCGFPTCGEAIEVQLKKQKYFIDRHARKIYEHRSESDMYCSRSCMQRSASIRAQLADEPLWLSGDISRRMRMSYKIERPVEESGMFAKTREIEVVRAVEEKLSDLRIREGESSTESEVEDYADDERDVKSFIKTVTNLIGVEDERQNIKESGKGAPSPKLPSDAPEKPKAVSKTATNASAKACAGQRPTSTRRLSEPPAVNAKLPDPQMASKLSLTQAELEKLSRLRGWITKRTHQLLRSGGLCISDSADSLMKQFFQPYGEDSAVDRNEVLLPCVDSIDVQKKRLHIFLDTVKKPLSVYQRELQFSFSRFNWLYVLVPHFTWNRTITDFSNDMLKLICLTLLKLISKLDNAVEDAVFPAGQPSEKFLSCLSKLGVEPHAFDTLAAEILENHEETS